MFRFNLALHVHFYQPPRQNPLTGHIGSERSAAPYRNWNERAVDDVYRPNTHLGNFRHISFDMGQALMDWLKSHHLDIYENILQTTPSNNILAAPLYQTPLPLLSPTERLTLLRWGMMDSQRRFGNQPKGIFLPMFAADLESLQSVVDAGFEFIVLRSSQVDGLLPRGGAGPYHLDLPSGDQLMVFVVDDWLSSTMESEMIERGGAGYWARQTLAVNCRHAGELTLLYLDGEKIGQHHMGEAFFVHYLMEYEALSAAYRPVTIPDYFELHPQSVGQITLQQSELHEAHHPLMDALQNTISEAILVMEDHKGDSLWTLDAKTVEQLSNPQDPVLRSYLHFHQALADCAGLSTYPQLSLDRILRDSAYAIGQLKNGTGVDLMSNFANQLDEPLRKLLTNQVGLIEEQVGEPL